MKNRNFYSIPLLLLLFVAVLACASEDKPNGSKTVIAIDEGVSSTKFDKYLHREFTSPYNIQFLYRMPDNESPMDHSLVPANYENSVKMANLFKYLCLDAYKEVAPPDFLKKYFPKTIMMIGSFAYQNNGTMILGTAEGGKKINMFGINDLDTENVQQLFDYYFRTIYHEFSHIMHQTIDYSNEFRMITATEYIGDSWSSNDQTLQIALEKGFVSRYSRKEPNEDFVELLAHYVTYSDSQWSEMLNNAGNGAPIIHKKMEFVKNYMLDTWKIDLDKLKMQIQQRINNLPQVDLTNID